MGQSKGPDPCRVLFGKTTSALAVLKTCVIQEHALPKSR
jgi:hypothetical protein